MPELETLLNIEDEVTQVLSDLGVTAKLDEMDDFMNQNDLKVSITNENTAVTGLVTYTCTVKDKDNTALANKVVEWYKGTTLIGIDATDSNGISTFSHRVTEADIYDVHAVVRGTHAGDDIRMFVKDNTNLLSHALWSGGEYGESELSSLTKANMTVTSDSGYSHIGNKSMKLVSTGTGSHSLRITHSNIDASLIGETATFTCYALIPTLINKIELSFYDTNSTKLTSINVTPPASNSEQQVSLAKVIPEDTVQIRINFTLNDVVNYCYADDLKLTIQ